MNRLTYTLILVCFFTLSTLGGNLYTSPLKTQLRAPSVPLITSDPYLSIWSPYDELTSGNTEHWTGTEHPLLGVLRVDGKTYRFMGEDRLELSTILPMTDQKAWEGSYTFEKPHEGWMNLNYDDSTWKKGKAAFGTKDYEGVSTPWKTQDIWVRRTFDLNDDITNRVVMLKYSHDDTFTLYLNGEKLVQTDYEWKSDVVLELNKAVKKKLKKGTNVIAVHCENNAGGAFVDFGLYYGDSNVPIFHQKATQLSVDVLPTQTYYSFQCGPVELNLVFTAPLLLNNLDLISTPINYISYEVKALDKKAHDVQIYFETTPELAVHQNSQPIMSKKESKGNFNYLKAGTIDQPITKRTGDATRIDWGYLYLASNAKSESESLFLGDYFTAKNQFNTNGVVRNSETELITRFSNGDKMPVLAYVNALGEVKKSEDKSGFVMLGYDDIYSIEYFYKRRPAYWKHEGDVTIYDAFERANKEYASVMDQCRSFDIQLMNDAEKAGGKKYAELCALAYRQAISAHKLIKDEEGNLLFLSKENNSNGCINTVDLTYPSSPLFLLYNTELMKGMMTPIFYYSESGRWNKPYPAHDLGTYPIANGQQYGEDMPIEEAGNMVILAMAISKLDNDASYAKKHWDTLTEWAEYLAEYGFDPANQLCTDDFAGHLARNANLSAKAIMAVASYAEVAKMLGKNSVYSTYRKKAKEMAVEWEMIARDEAHYMLAFGNAGTWSQKYNIIWDVVFDLDVFPKEIIEKELAFYLTKQNKYGLPLDSRADYTKSDWVMWVASLADSEEVFEELIAPIYKYADETNSRDPLSDWHDTHDARRMNFKARSVVGGYFMKLLKYKIENQDK